MAMKIKIFEKNTLQRLETALNKFYEDKNRVVLDQRICIERDVNRGDKYYAAVWYTPISDK